ARSVLAEGAYVRVRDAGPALAGDKVGGLFEAFYTTKPDGIGMGLAISRSIIEAHGGRLWATPNVPRGAVLQFTLPIDGEQAAMPAQKRPGAEEGGGGE